MSLNSIYDCGDIGDGPEMDDTSLSSRASSRILTQTRSTRQNQCMGECMTVSMTTTAAVTSQATRSQTSPTRTSTATWGRCWTSSAWKTSARSARTLPGSSGLGRTEKTRTVTPFNGRNKLIIISGVSTIAEDTIFTLVV